METDGLQSVIVDLEGADKMDNECRNKEVVLMLRLMGVNTAFELFHCRVQYHSQKRQSRPSVLQTLSHINPSSAPACQ